MAKSRKAKSGDVASNRSASYRYNLHDRYEAGLVLQGTEVKSLRDGKATLKDAYASVDDGEIWLHNFHIPPYPPAARENHEPERPRKLLLHRAEIERLMGNVKQKGWTLIPTRVYFAGGRAKAEIALASGKDSFDKRQGIRDREVKRDMQRALRDANR